MKYCKRFCIYAAFLIVMCSTWIEDGSAQTWMPDTTLRAKVLAELKKLNSGTTEITETNVTTLTELEAGGSGTTTISDLTGLEKATNLTELDLNNNQISDISALKGLTALTELDLSNNQINDISALKDLTNLQTLYLHGNQIYRTDANIAALKSLTALTHLHLVTATQNDFLVLEGALDEENPDESGLRALLVTPPPTLPVTADELAATADELAATADEPVETRRIIIYQCPVGWVRSTVFGNAKKAMIYELKVDVDLTNHFSLYTLKSIAIYVHPDEGLQTLEGWYLTTGTLYNHHHGNKFHLTAENSVIDEQGFAHIQNPDATPIRMGTLSFIGQSLPSFDYRLYDERGMRVDFGISCYKGGGLTRRLWNTKDPRVVRILPLVENEAGLKGMMKDLNWDAFFFPSEWTAAIMPDLSPENAPAAPSRGGVGIVGTWADLKK